MTKEFFVLSTEKPYKANLQCVETFSGDKIDSAANGDILILARQMASTTFFYCAVSKSHQIYIYVDHEVIKILLCYNF